MIRAATLLGEAVAVGTWGVFAMTVGYLWALESTGGLTAIEQAAAIRWVGMELFPVAFGLGCLGVAIEAGARAWQLRSSRGE